MLYQFQSLQRFLERKGIPKLSGDSSFEVFREVDYQRAVATDSKSISITSNGIFYEIDGQKYRGYMYLSTYRIGYTENSPNYPKFHVTKCRVLRQFEEQNQAHRYVWSNKPKVDVTDKNTGKMHKDRNLDLCGYCRKEMLNTSKKTVGFSTELVKEHGKTTRKKNNTDIYGYLPTMTQKSRRFRESQNFICNACGVQPRTSIDRMYWHTHHKSGNKLDNSVSNLLCLCIVCHANVDKHHRKNFNTLSNQKRINAFIKSYRQELKEVNNGYVSLYLEDEVTSKVVKELTPNANQSSMGQDQIGTNVALKAVGNSDETEMDTATLSKSQLNLPFHWVRTDAELASCSERLSKYTELGLDCETTIPPNRLCLLQIACRDFTVLIDPFGISDFNPIKAVLEDLEIVVIAHNASFEKKQLKTINIEINNVYDTLSKSRKLRGPRSKSGEKLKHKLSDLCRRELGFDMDKSPQKSDWEQRPLSKKQIEYAALDAEVMLRLYNAFQKASKA